MPTPGMRRREGENCHLLSVALNISIPTSWHSCARVSLSICLETDVSGSNFHLSAGGEQSSMEVHCCSRPGKGFWGLEPEWLPGG